MEILIYIGTYSIIPISSSAEFCSSNFKHCFKLYVGRKILLYLLVGNTGRKGLE